MLSQNSDNMADVPVKKEEQLAPKPAAAAATAPPPEVASDPEEDDLSDLDGMFAKNNRKTVFDSLRHA